MFSYHDVYKRHDAVNPALSLSSLKPCHGLITTPGQATQDPSQCPKQNEYLVNTFISLASTPSHRMLGCYFWGPVWLCSSSAISLIPVQHLIVYHCAPSSIAVATSLSLYLSFFLSLSLSLSLSFSLSDSLKLNQVCLSCLRLETRASPRTMRKLGSMLWML